MLDMCKYNMASQQNSTTQSIYSLGSKEPDITNMGVMTQHAKHIGNGSVMENYAGSGSSCNSHNLG